jgi:hypothetical protein
MKQADLRPNLTTKRTRKFLAQMDGTRGAVGGAALPLTRNCTRSLLNRASVLRPPTHGAAGCRMVNPGVSFGAANLAARQTASGRTASVAALISAAYSGRPNAELRSYPCACARVRWSGLRSRPCEVAGRIAPAGTWIPDRRSASGWTCMRSFMQPRVSSASHCGGL